MPSPDEIEHESWSPAFERAMVPPERVDGSPRNGAGRAVAWMKVVDPLGDPEDASAQLLHRCWLAFLSDDLPTDAVFRAHPVGAEPERSNDWFSASLDHTVWFHRPIAADRWHLHDFACVHFVGGRGLAIGYIFDTEGVHLATVAQEVLMRTGRGPPS